MYMIIQLYHQNCLEDVLMALTEAGVDDTVVVTGETVRHRVMFNMPLFAGFRNDATGNEYAAVIVGIAERSQVDFMLAELAKSGVDLNADELGRVVLLPAEIIV